MEKMFRVHKTMHEMPGLLPVELATCCSNVRVDSHHTAQHDTTLQDHNILK